MGGRGASGGRGGSPESIARKAFEERNGTDLTDLKKELKWWRDEEKRGATADDMDSDQHFWVIDKNGDEHFYQPGVDTFQDSGIKMNKIAYIQQANGDGIWDSNGMNTINKETERLFSDSEKFERYNDEINRLYNTSWGKRNKNR